MAVNWPSGVNKRFYNLNTTTNENIEITEFESGKKRTILKNSSPKRSFSVSLDFNNSTEELAFWVWYDNVLLSRSQSFYMLDFLGQSETKEYLMTSEPTVQNGQFPKEVNITVEEV